MEELQNPYVPGAGIQPPELTGRDVFLEHAQMTIKRAERNFFSKSFIAVGLRGVGKTVVLNRIKRIAEAHRCEVALIEVHEDRKLSSLLVPVIRKILLSLDRRGSVSASVKYALRTLKSFLSVIKVSYEGIELSIDPEVGVADTGDLEIDLPDLFVAIGKAAMSKNVTIVFILDEIQYLSEKEMSALVMSMHKTSQENLPVILMGAGLPLLVGKIGESKSYAERLFNFPEIGALSYEDACKAINSPAKREGVEFDDRALKKIFKITQGYPYFIQEWAYVCWNIANGPVITCEDVEKATSKVITRLDQSFFRVRFDRLTPREKQYLRAMAELGHGPHRSGDIAEKLRVPSNKLGPCRSTLISKGMVYSPSYGDTAFTVPLFDEYMKRTMPFATWNEPE